MSNKNLIKLNTIGQSIWYDNLSRDVLESGELADLISAGVSGLTSNPTIFQKAISGSDKYDQALSLLMTKNSDVEVICEELMLQDVAAAADLLLPTYNSSSALDGYASIEVSPLLANDSEATIQAARRLWDKLKRPNIMIKIPATNAGLTAIEAVLAEGINVNVTLIFSDILYQQVAQCYIRALRKRVKQGLAIDRLASVASFFVSRVDSIVEKQLASYPANLQQELLGKIGIANSLIAYDSYQQLFVQGLEFQSLRKHSAQPQRPLWASTSTKNPQLDPLLYVSALALADTVNTMPPATLAVLMASDSFTTVSISKLQASDYLQNLHEHGVVLENLLAELLLQGVQAFVDSYNELLKAITAKLAKLK